MKKFLQNIVKLKKISTIKDFRFGTFPSISGSGSGSGYTFYRTPFKMRAEKSDINDQFENFFINNDGKRIYCRYWNEEQHSESTSTRSLNYPLV